MIWRPSYRVSITRISGLALVLGVAWLLPNERAQALATWIGSWDYVVRHDHEGRPQAAFARLRGDNDALLWLTCARPSAESGLPDVVSLTATISQKGYLGRSTPRGRSTVYWFDDGSPELSYWVYRDKAGQLSSVAQVSTFVERLKNAQSLVVELSDYHFETQRSEFQFNRAETQLVADRFRQDCRDIAGGRKLESPQFR